MNPNSHAKWYSTSIPILQKMHWPGTFYKALCLSSLK